MYHGFDLPDSIPVFPLPGALLLPRARLPLHIFEPRYLAMLDDTLKTQHRLIGMLQPVGGAKDGDRLHLVGCAGRVTTFSETEDGRYMITLTGISRFRVVDEPDGFAPYRMCDVDWSQYESDLGAPQPDSQFERVAFLDLLERYFTSQDLKTDWESLRDAEDELLINSLSMLCPFEPEDKQVLLEARDLAARRDILTTLFEFALHGGSAGSGGSAGKVMQ
jgi:Lon protease-like protein